MTARLIINADDYGWDDASCAAILQLSECGKISSTTIMANMVQPTWLIEARNLDGISTGLHLNLLYGRPLSSPKEVPSLTGSDGMFLDQKTLLRRLAVGKIRAADVALEVRRQFMHLTANGITVSHADSHKHIHQYPLIGPVILRTFMELGIRRVRRCRVDEWQNCKMTVVRMFNTLTAGHMRVFCHPDSLVSSFSLHRTADMDTFTRAMARNFPRYSLVEFMTHPALSGRPDSYLNREAEYRFWLDADWQNGLKDRNIQVISYLNL